MSGSMSYLEGLVKRRTGFDTAVASEQFTSDNPAPKRGETYHWEGARMRIAIGVAAIAILAGILVTETAQADSLSDAALVTALRQGGYVLLMRHASSPPAPPTAGSAEQDNTKLERQLMKPDAARHRLWAVQSRR